MHLVARRWPGSRALGCRSRARREARGAARRRARVRGVRGRARVGVRGFGRRRRLDPARGVDAPGGARRARRRPALVGPRAFGMSLVAMAAADPLVAVRRVVPALGGCHGRPARVRAALRAAPRGRGRGAGRLGRPCGRRRRWRRLSRARPSLLGSRRRCRSAGSRRPGRRAARRTVALPLCLVARAPVGVAGRGARVRPRGVGGARPRPRRRARRSRRGGSRCTSRRRRRGSWQLVALSVAFARNPCRGAAWGPSGRRASRRSRSRSVARRRGAPRGVLRATFLDVGRETRQSWTCPTGGARDRRGGLVGSPIDTGARVLAPVLRARRRTTPRSSVLTHPHPDHFGGLVTGLDAGARGERLGHGAGRARRDGGRLRGVPRGDPRPRRTGRRPGEVCGVHAMAGRAVEVLAPVPGVRPIAAPNDNRSSCASPTGRARFSSWATPSARRRGPPRGGRAEPARGPTCSRSGHHGSRRRRRLRSSPRCGRRMRSSRSAARNRFGHPNPVTLARSPRRGPASGERTRRRGHGDDRRAVARGPRGRGVDGRRRSL